MPDLVGSRFCSKHARKLLPILRSHRTLLSFCFLVAIRCNPFCHPFCFPFPFALMFAFFFLLPSSCSLWLFFSCCSSPIPISIPPTQENFLHTTTNKTLMAPSNDLNDWHQRATESISATEGNTRLSFGFLLHYFCCPPFCCFICVLLHSFLFAPCASREVQTPTQTFQLADNECAPPDCTCARADVLMCV